MRKNVLIYPGNSYPAEEIYYCLNKSLRYRPIIGNHGEAHAQYITNNFYSDLPLVNDENFIHIMNEFINKNEVSFMIPTHDTVADYLMKHEKEINCTIVCSCSETAEICRHKEQTYFVLKGCNFLPRIYSPNAENIEFPVFAKDDIGQGGKNAGVINSKNELNQLLANNDINYVISEYLPGSEISIDCFTDRHGKLQFCQPRLRETILTGMSGRSRILECSKDILDMASTINSKIRFRGYWYFQCKKDTSGKYKLMEISTRFAGTYSLSKNLDVNLPLLALTDFEDIDVKIVPNKYGISADRGYINRYKLDIQYDRVYLDFDDTLVFDRKTYIIPTMAFLFQCINENKEIIILTRHAFDIQETMKSLHLDTKLFTDIIEVESNKRKSDYISTDKQSILIDNSFAERLDVKENAGIPTFDICNLDCLLEVWD